MSTIPYQHHYLHNNWDINTQMFKHQSDHNDKRFYHLQPVTEDTNTCTENGFQLHVDDSKGGSREQFFLTKKLSFQKYQKEHTLYKCMSMLLVLEGDLSWVPNKRVTFQVHLQAFVLCFFVRMYNISKKEHKRSTCKSELRNLVQYMSGAGINKVLRIANQSQDGM